METRIAFPHFYAAFHDSNWPTTSPTSSSSRPAWSTAPARCRWSGDGVMKVIADRDICIGAGMWMAAAAIFDQDEDGIVVAVDEVSAEEQQRAHAAVSMCPSGALRLSA